MKNLDTLIVFFGVALWSAQYAIASLVGSLSPRQMRERFFGQSILPLIWHGGIWFDLPLTFFLAYLTYTHPEWTWWQWLVSLGVGGYASWFMHTKLYAPATKRVSDPRVIVTQESHVQNGAVTVVGSLHGVFFALMMAVILNEGLFSKQPSAKELWVTVGVVATLLFVGNHMVLGIVKALTGKPVDYKAQPLKSAPGWATVVGGTFAAVTIVLLRANGVW